MCPYNQYFNEWIKLEYYEAQSAIFKRLLVILLHF